MMLEMSAPAFSQECDQDTDWHCIVYHKQRTSARTRFLRLGRDVVLPGNLDDDAELADAPPRGPVVSHPAAGLSLISRTYGVAASALRVDAEALGTVAGSDTPVWLVEAVTTDPPQLEHAGARFVSIMEMRDLPPLQQTLLRMAYERILG